MLEIKLKTNNLTVVFSLGLALIFICWFSAYRNLRGYLFYQRAFLLEKPSLQLGLEEYYQQAISLTSQAINYSPVDTDYLARKADYIFGALNDGLGSQLLIKAEDAQGFYLRAVELNPLNFEYHLKLAWFYSGSDDQKAEEEFKKAVSLCPFGAQPYVLLAKYYLGKSDYAAGFGNLIVVLQYSREEWYKLLVEVEGKINNGSPITLDDKERTVFLEIFPGNYEFEFKKAKFPHAKIPVRIKVYTDAAQAEPSLYLGRVPYARFTKLGGTEENIYELSVDEAKNEGYLDDFIIKTADYSPIKKIEIIKALSY